MVGPEFTLLNHALAAPPPSLGRPGGTTAPCHGRPYKVNSHSRFDLQTGCDRSREVRRFGSNGVSAETDYVMVGGLSDRYGQLLSNPSLKEG